MPSFKLDGVHRLVPAPHVSDVRLAADGQTSAYEEKEEGSQNYKHRLSAYCCHVFQTN